MACESYLDTHAWNRSHVCMHVQCEGGVEEKWAKVHPFIACHHDPCDVQITLPIGDLHLAQVLLLKSACTPHGRYINLMI